MQPLELNADLLERAEANARSGGFVSLRAISNRPGAGIRKNKEPDSTNRRKTRKSFGDGAAGYLDEGLDI